MKKRLFVLGIAMLAIAALLIPSAFAADDNTPDKGNYQEFFNQMFDWHKNQLDQAVKDGQLSEEQAKAWEEQLNQMKEFHSQNGFGPMGAMMGNGFCPGAIGNYNGYGMGPGMMGNFGPSINN